LAQHEAFYTLPHHRKKQRIIRDAFNANCNTKYVERLEYCGFPDRETGVRYCHVRTCPICQWRRNQQWVARAYKRVPELIATYPTARFGLLTLTVRNCAVADLRTTITLMGRAWQRLRQRREFKPFIGYMREIEVTRCHNGTAHPHIHVLLMAKASVIGHNYVRKGRWTELWQESLQVDYAPQTNIKWFARETASPLHQVAGTAKYLTKEQPCTIDFDWFVEMAYQTHATKAISLGGEFRSFFAENSDVLDSAIALSETNQGLMASPSAASTMIC
jgi:hypothetical protein